MGVDETAKAILESTASEPDNLTLVENTSYHDEFDTVCYPLELPHLQSLAKLWLLLPNLVERFEQSRIAMCDLACIADVDNRADMPVEAIKAARARASWGRTPLEYASFIIADNSSLLADLEELQETGLITPRESAFEILFGDVKEP